MFFDVRLVQKTMKRTAVAERYTVPEMICRALMQTSKGGKAMQIFKKSLSILLSLIMVFSVFTIIPFAAQATTSNVWYYYRYWFDREHAVTTERRYANATLLRELDGGIDDLYSGWYYSEGWKSFDDRVTIQGTVNIIITDSSYVRFDDGIHVGAGNTLNIYGQDRDDQYLEAIADTNDNAAIGANNQTDHCGNINIYGGAVKADAASKGTNGTLSGSKKITVADGANIVYN